MARMPRTRVGSSRPAAVLPSAEAALARALLRLARPAEPLLLI
ncbi:hypothetical protein [Chthonobacter rhizosphaerae]|nr:hypothetical protein [Chthonobacter rhizosphaerae]